MKKNRDTRGLICYFVILGILILGGCRNVNSPSLNSVEIPNDKPQLEEATQMPATDPTVIPAPVVVEVAIDECVACHEDKEMLIQTAKPVVEVESENEGAG